LPPLWALGAAVGLGLLMAGVGFNVGHDALHGAYSAKPWVNRLLGRSFDVMGASSAFWARAHNVVHHTFTNLSGLDGDLEPGPWLVLYPRARPSFLHRFQHLYAPLLYAFTMLVWVVKKDVADALRPHPQTGKRTTALEWAELLASKALHVTLFLVLPLLLSGYAWWMVLVGYAVVLGVTGLSLALVFQSAHVVENVEVMPADQHAKRSWAEHQLRTTADFAPHSAVAGFVFGGLNRQIEHHLFSRICHIHYPALAPLVAQVAKDFGVPYLVNPSFGAALASHFRVLRRLGQPAEVLAPAVVATVG
jgi:linoleoyl-CoA desaturase